MPTLGTNTVGIFSGKAHKAPGLEEKRTMLLNIVTRPPEEYFLIGSKQLDDFKAVKAECYAGWSTSSARARVWTAAFTADKLARLLFSASRSTPRRRSGRSHPRPVKIEGRQLLRPLR